MQLAGWLCLEGTCRPAQVIGDIRPEREHSRPLAAAGRTAPSVDGALASSAFSRCVRRKTRAAHDKTTNMCARLAVSNDIVTSACAFPLETQ